MDVCHLILGRPWQFDVDAHYEGRANVYSLDWKGRKLRLLPKPTEASMSVTGATKQAAAHLVSGPVLIQSWREPSPMFALLIVETTEREAADTVYAEDIRLLLQQFKDVCPHELPAELPPLRNIQHQIDFHPNAMLPNLPHYRLSPKEQQILAGIVDDLLQKQLIQSSLSPCAVPALLVQKRTVIGECV
ncbi:hypothetical protein KFK09_008486 [Dendrobium nobile]|uniref:Uncharacterized protein n=1 Tax=Dendrobium nobile TaxID=94219 RepID=A0A8T3BMW8_DENNO|nr:hypothetical protein KFK09_008486 [Dendrobium nobile]